MGTARHCGHHNTFPAAFRTQSITATKEYKQRQKLLPNFFFENKEIAFIYVDLGHLLRFEIII
jgi:hypothetical protein